MRLGATWWRRPVATQHSTVLFSSKRCFSQALDVSSTAALVSDAAARRLKGLDFEEQVVVLMRTFQCDLHATQMSNDGGIDHRVCALCYDLHTVHLSMDAEHSA